MRGPALRTVALGIAMACTLFWLWFGLGSATGERLGIANWLLHAFVPGGLLLVSLFIAWKWELAGGVLLLIEGIVLEAAYLYFMRPIGHFPASTIALVTTLLGLPLISGLLLLLDRRAARARHA